jgi:hypothetical protein
VSGWGKRADSFSQQRKDWSLGKALDPNFSENLPSNFDSTPYKLCDPKQVTEISLALTVLICKIGHPTGVSWRLMLYRSI